jgi:hypothetical protein
MPNRAAGMNEPIAAGLWCKDLADVRLGYVPAEP